MHQNNIVNLQKYNNEWFKPGKKTQIILWYIISYFFFTTSIPFPSKYKIFILKLFKAKTGKNITLKPRVRIKYPWHLIIQDNTWIGEDVWIDNLALVNIGKNVCISQGAMLLTGNHNYKKTTFDLMLGEITIDDGVWIGAKSLVSPGVHCKSHSILAACSIATTDLEPYFIYQGNPASKKRKREIN